MSRLADYFVVVGYDHEKERSGQSCGRIIQRFPEKDWDDCPYTQGIDLFCQPAGWELSTVRQQPTFFVSVLTDIDADRHYCACLTFNEGVTMASGKTGGEEEADEQDSELVRHSIMFAPKSLVLVSRVDCFETFRNCLGLIYTVYLENIQVQLETLIGNILGCVQVPPPGGPQVRFSIGAGDRQCLQPPLCPTLPVTRYTIAALFQQLGINNVLSVFSAAVTDCKVLFHSQSYSRLTDSGQAITALMYPLKYSYVYIPLLPAGLIEVLSTPTPFIAGVHSSLKAEFSELLDVIIVDLDGGSISVPECVQLSVIPEPHYSRLVTQLTMILKPDLLNADAAYPPAVPRPPMPEMQDKEIRAVMTRFFAELMFGYRSCLTVIRIHPDPFITFHKANFLGHRGLVEEDFVTKVLDGMSFGTFVADRGPPYRVCDIFDEVYASMPEVLKEEDVHPEKILPHIKDLATQLYINENPNPQPYVQKIPKPPDGAHARIHQPQFPVIDWVHVQEIIDEGVAKHSIKSKLTQMRPMQQRIVPMGPHITSSTDRHHFATNYARRLEVLHNCISFIFENKITDARKIFPAVLRALKGRVARQALVQELNFHVQSNRAMLEHQQFDLVVRLLNNALQNDSSMDENGIAAAIIPLATAFCRKLCTGVIQFIYTCIQEHAVWASQSFWESAFYQDVQKDIRGLYAPQYEEHFLPEKDPSMSPSSFRDHRESGIRDSWRGGTFTPDSQRRSVTSTSTIFKPSEISALEIAAEQLRVWPNSSHDDQKEMINNEESTVYSQAIHYANRMVYMRVPLDASKQLKHAVTGLEESNSSNITNSLAESDSFDAESGFDEQEVTEVGSNVVRFVTRFIDKVCTESGVTDDHIRSLHQMIPGVVAMHIETLEGVHRESKRLPPIQKPKILTPTFLPGEEIIMEGLRVYLVPDGREEGTGSGSMGGPALLPAEGAVFLTTYRIIFKGTPVDPLVCEHTICRCFPVSTLTREKKVSVQSLAHVDQWMQEGLQLRSNTFQLMKITFDEEVGPESIETFRKLLNKVRNPPSVLATFAFTGGQIIQATPLHKHKEKNSSLKGFTKKTLMRTARKVGIKTKDPNRKQKFIMPTPPLPRRGLDVVEMRDRPHSISCDEELSVIEENDLMMAIQTDSKNIDRLAERLYCLDYQRLGLGSVANTQTRSRSEPFRISLVNTNYSVCRSYPAVLVVPQTVPDESIRKFARSHRQYRFPVVVWRHPKTKAVLLRASGFHGKGVMGMLKSQHTAAGTSGSETSMSVEQEKYFSALVSATPAGNPRFTPASNTSDSLNSLDSLMLSTATVDSLVPQTPDSSRKNPISRAVSSLRHSGGKVKFTPGEVLATPVVSRKNSESSTTSSSSNPFTRTFGSLRISGGKGSKSLGRLGSHRDKRYATSASLQSGMSVAGMKQNGTIDSAEMYDLSANNFHKAALYVLGEKTQMKGIKLESFPKCDFIPVEFHEVRHIKSSFKKMMRACVPSSASSDAQMGGFYKAVEESDWLPQLQSIMQIAGATVDLLDVQGSSVLICLEDGWDFTTQVVSVAQLLMDPYYRTIEGFQTLVQKEWLSFGHRFTHRSNQTAANQASGFAPIFLQFLDVVHQIHHQFPLSFEFNQFYLRFLAYHYVSNRFRTFMLDNESERMEAGWLLEERKPTTPTDGEGSSPKHQPGMTVWDFISRHHRRSSVFYNFMYSGRDHDVVLRPYSNISNLRIWDYYIMEDLNHGPPYELDAVAKEARQEEEQALVDGILLPGQRRIINGCYHNREHLQPNSFTYMFQEIHKLEVESEAVTQKWRYVWEKLELPRQEQLTRQVSFNTQIVRSHGRSIHKRSTIELLVRGKMLGEASRMFSQPHHFEKYTYTTPAYCDYCNHVLWGLVKTGMRCSDCGYNCHEKCTTHVPKNCTRLKPSTEGGSSDAHDDVKENMGDVAAAVSGEHRTHEGYLYKRGALLKGWKQRFFVLDSMKHQLRYYDEKEDPHCKGFTDLAEVISVTPIKNVQGAPKKADEGAFFEMKTQRRLYHFLAPDSAAAQEWIDKIQSCIQ